MFYDNNANLFLGSYWDTSSVTNMEIMFFITEFPWGNLSNIQNWNTSNVTNMFGMLAGQTSFNQDIGNWDTSNVTNMTAMLNGTTSFNQDLSGWCVANITTEPENFSNNSALINANKPVWGTCPD